MVLHILVRLVAAAPAGGWHFSLILWQAVYHAEFRIFYPYQPDTSCVYLTHDRVRTDH